MLNNELNNKFNKALFYLDKGKIAEAKTILNEALEKTKDNSWFCVRINTVLGDLYFREGDIPNARKHLNEALNTPLDEDMDDLVDYELELCKEILNKI
ncbi:MAG: hypothetical protein LBO72_10500 [Helicobacteraceae bacterium]|jgi:tetratricopeptide (TPR) repeat protein|nr:hypothetical protein [Helicobacteraceae bacterium]